jgi:kinesin family protein 20
MTSIKQKGTVTKVIREVRKFVPDCQLPSDNEEAMMTETDDVESVAETGTTRSEMDDDVNEDDSEYDEEDEEDNWVPSTASSSNRNKTPKAKVIQRYPSSSPGPSRDKNTQSRMLAERNRVSKLEQKMDDLVLDDPDDSVVILPVTKYKARQRPSTNETDDDDMEMEISAAKKKKR